MLLDVRGVNKRFGGLHAVRGASFSVDRGEVVGLIGPNGAGKTTLFNCVSGFLRPDDGRVVLDGEEITGKSPHLIARRGLARTFQLSRPLRELSVLDNVVVGAWLRSRNRREAVNRAWRALAQVHMAEKASLPAHDLTAAERKRLELGRCLAMSPSILLLDEVVAGCSEVEMERLLQTIRELREEGMAVVMVEHVLRAVMAISDRVLLMANGEVIVEGSPDEIRHDPRAIEIYLGHVDSEESERPRTEVQS